jgi:hypothetical protein
MNRTEELSQVDFVRVFAGQCHRCRHGLLETLHDFFLLGTERGRLLLEGHFAQGVLLFY